MGVRGLESYLEQNCKTAVCMQNIEELAKKQRTSDDQELIIVVDGFNCIKHMYGDLSWIGGGQLREYEEKIKKFVKAFHDKGIRLVFFFDGSVVQKKRETWVNRRMTTMNKAYKTFGKIDEGVPSDTIPINECFILPPGTLQLTMFLLENVCCEVHTSVFDCDEEIAEFSRNQGVFGVLAHDSDFLIFDIGPAMYFDTVGLELETMTTRVYYPEVLAQSLGLYMFQLPLFATLIGNDFITYEELKYFHYKLLSGKPRKVEFLFPSVARFIQTLPTYFLQRKVLLKLSENVFGNASRAEDIKTCVTSYKALFRPEQVQDFQKRSMSEKNKDCDVHRKAIRDSEDWRRDINCEINWRERNSMNWRDEGRKEKEYEQCINWREESRKEKEYDQWIKLVRLAGQLHHENKLPNSVFVIIKEQLYEVGSAFEDFRISPRDLPIFAELTFSLRRRLYGILLQQKPVKLGSHSVEEWCMAGPGSLERSSLVSAVAPCVHHPGLLALWGEQDRPEGRLNDIRWSLFVHSVSPRLDVQRVCLLPPNIVIPTLTVYYMLDYAGPGRLEEWEADIVLATAAVMPHYSLKELAAIPADPMTSRSIRVSSLVMRVCCMLHSLLAACGCPLSNRETAPWKFFDGKLFQLKYRESHQYRFFHPQLCDNRDDSLEIFQLARCIIYDKARNY